MASEHPIILHHFPQSPFSEKVRLVFGLKRIAWTSVLITRIMPRPDLMPMTGGYRRTPVMQIAPTFIATASASSANWSGVFRSRRCFPTNAAAWRRPQRCGRTGRSSRAR